MWNKYHETNQIFNYKKIFKILNDNTQLNSIKYLPLYNLLALYILSLNYENYFDKISKELTIFVKKTDLTFFAKIKPSKWLNIMVKEFNKQIHTNHYRCPNPFDFELY